MKTLIISSLFLLSTCAAVAATPSLTGNWNIHISVAGTDADMTCALIQKDTKLTGTCTGDQGTSALTGTVTGNQATWTYNSQYQGDPITLTYTATLDGSKTITGAVDVEPYAVSGEFTATPAPAAATPAPAASAPAAQ